MIRKILGGVGTILFSLFAYWQLNDLSQYGTQWWHGWVLTYSLTALLCLASFFLLLPRWIYWGAAVLAIIHAVFRFLAIQPEKKILYNPDNPAGNETGGLIVVCIWLVLISLSIKKVSPKGE